MNDTLKSIMLGSITVILSSILSSKLDDTSIIYIIILSINFGLFVGFITYELLWNKKHKKTKKDVLTRNDTKRGVLVGITTGIILITAFIGVQSTGDFLPNDLFKLKLLVISIGYVGLCLGNISKYFNTNE